VYVPDTVGSGLQDGLTVPGWRLRPLRVELTWRTLDTTLGDPTVEADHVFERLAVMASFLAERPGGGAGIFFKTFAAVAAYLWWYYFAAGMWTPPQLGR
jgi:hypothetical protein